MRKRIGALLLASGLAVAGSAATPSTLAAAPAGTAVAASASEAQEFWQVYATGLTWNECQIIGQNGYQVGIWWRYQCQYQGYWSGQYRYRLIVEVLYG